MSPPERCGRIRSAEFASFEIVEFLLQPGLSLPLHSHDRPAIAIGLQGRCELVDEAKVLSPLGHGDLLTIPEDLRHRETVEGRRFRCLMIFGRGTRLALPDGFRRTSSDPIRVLGRLLAEAVDTEDRLGAEATAHELIAMTHVRVASDAARTSRPDWLARVATHLNDCFRSPPSLDELSREVGVSREHLARVFRRETGLTVGQFVRLRRVLEAADHLRGHDADLSDVAFRFGYADQSHLTREFRRHLGTTPHRHRRRFHGSG